MREWKELLSLVKTQGWPLEEEQLNRLSPEERSQVEQLSPEEDELLQDLVDGQQVQASLELLESTDPSQEWAHTLLRISVHAYMAQSTASKPSSDSEISSLFSRSLDRLRPYVKYAAVLALPVLIGALYFFICDSPYFSTPLAEHSFPEMVHERGRLIMADGRTMDLSELVTSIDSGEFLTLDVARIASDVTALAVDGKPAAGSGSEVISAFHRLIIPRGAEYRLVLSDGTRVHLNSETELRFPTNFEGLQERKVFLDQGEAFFEVSPDAQRPFRVEVSDLDITVLGTAFNVNTYAYPAIEATLLSGKVQADFQGRETVLNPSEQVKVDAHSGDFQVREVDVNAVMAWHYNEWVFDNTTLRMVLESLGRWYDHEVVFVDEEVGDLLYTANLEKYISVSKVLSLIEMTGQVRFKVKGRTIYVFKGGGRV